MYLMIDKKRIELLFSTAETMGLKPKTVTDRGLISIEVNGKERYFFHKASNPNTHAASLLSTNKYASRVVFEKAGLPNIPFCVPANNTEAINFLSMNGRIIVKPIKGEKSQNIHLISSEADLKELDLRNCILEKFIKGQETRLLVVNGEVKTIHKKVYDSEINDPSTVQRISIERENWDSRLMILAVKAADAIGLKFTAVDFLITDEDEPFILEINSAPGIEHFQRPDQGPSIDIMRLFLEELISNSNVKPGSLIKMQSQVLD
jgi:glutathione synthase/RimK-type ligase-like ATP-grasp enzyme